MVMDIRLARIDDRLIHGQVATVWAKLTNINRILVVSDSVAHDNLRKALLVQAAPPGVKVNVITVQKMIDVYPDPRFDSFRAMLLFTNPLDVKRVVEGGVQLTSVNIGGMITNAVAVDANDLKAFLFLNEQGIELEIRKVAADSQVNLMDLLKKERSKENNAS